MTEIAVTLGLRIGLRLVDLAIARLEADRADRAEIEKLRAQSADMRERIERLRRESKARLSE